MDFGLMALIIVPAASRSDSSDVDVRLDVLAPRPRLAGVCQLSKRTGTGLSLAREGPSEGFPWLGNRLDDSHKTLAVGLDGKLVVAPPGPPFGMPGGMIGRTVDPSHGSAGILFASIARPDPNNPANQTARSPPRLRSDHSKRTLEQLRRTVLLFFKFVPPTIAGRPRFSSDVLE